MKILTISEADVVYQLLHSSDKLWSPDDAQQRTVRKLAKAALLRERSGGLPHVTNPLFDQFRKQVLKAREDGRMLPDEDQAVLCAIRAEPEYRFIGSERRIANRLAEQGILRPALLPARFLVTYHGYTRYSWDRVSRSRLQ